MGWFKRKFFWKRPDWSKTFYEYLISYIVIVCLALIIVTAVVFNGLLPRVEQEVKAGNLSLLMQVRETMDMRTQEMNRIAHRISIHPDLTPFMLGNGGYGLYKSQRQLEEYRSSNSFVHDLAVFYNFRDDWHMYAASGMYTLDSYFNDIYRYRDWEKNEFLAMMSNIYLPIMRPLETIQVNGRGTGQFATYLYPLPINSDNPYGVVMFLIEEKEFAAMFQNVLHTDIGHAFILNDQQQLVAYASATSNQGEPQAVLDELQMMSLPVGVHTIKAASDKWSVVKLTSEVNGWTYMTAIPNVLTMKQVDSYQKLFLNTIVVILVIGLIASFLLTMRNYRPLKGLAEVVRSQNPNSSFAGKSDEISIISYAFSEVAKENDGLLSMIKSQAVALKEQALSTLLRGKIRNKAELEQILKLANLSLDYPQYVVLNCWIDEYQRFIQGNTPFMQELLKYSLINVLEELALGLGKGYGLKWTDDRGIAFILNIRNDVGKSELEALSERASHFFEQHFGYKLTVGIGKTYSDSFMIYRSYVEAVKAAEYRFLKGHGQILFYDLTTVRQGRKFWYPTDLQNNLVIAIKQGNNDEVQRTVQEMTSRITHETMTIEMAEYICFDIINLVMKTMIEMRIQLEDYIDDSMGGLFSPKYETMEELEEMVINFCSKVCDYINETKESKNANLYQSVQLYINKHFTDPTISLESIAAMFDVSPSYLSRYFKNQTGYPLMRYIDEMRMNKAKELFEHSDLLIKDITEHVGYIDQTNFNRKFKRLEGVTPMQYRNITRGATRNNRTIG